jgi:hypothetical protein
MTLTGTYTDEAVLTMSPIALPSAAFEMRFRPRSGANTTDINLEISAEPPDSGHTAHARPLLMYSSYYELAVPAVELPKRVLPYQSPVNFSAAASGKLQDGSLSQPTPRPLCGAKKVIY